MKITAWRIFKKRHARSAFSGEGAKRFGGRWNRPGVAMVYTSGSVSLAVLELLVHLESSQILGAYRVCSVSFDESLVSVVQAKELPANWKTYPAPLKLQLIGEKWIAGAKSAVLRVPSVIVENEFNYLLNPLHPDFGSIQIGKPKGFEFDSRLG